MYCFIIIGLCFCFNYLFKVIVPPVPANTSLAETSNPKLSKLLSNYPPRYYSTSTYLFEWLIMKNKRGP